MLELSPEILLRLSRNQCAEYPSCNCVSFLWLWANLLSDEDKVWNRKDLREDLRIAEDMIFIKLCCLLRCCPDDEDRHYAKEQLREPFWKRQWAKSIREH